MLCRSRISLLAITTCLALSNIALAADPGPLGRWNLTIEFKDDKGNVHSHPGWLAVESRSGKHTARILGGAGSVGPIGEISVDGNTIAFDAWDYHFTGTVDGDTISGERVHKNDPNNRSNWHGKRSRPVYNADGKWALKVLGQPAEHPAIVEIKTDGENVSGTCKIDGATHPITSGTFRMGLLHFTVGTDSGDMTMSAAVMGDRLGFGMLSRGKIRHRFEGYRIRNWGHPIELFNGMNLDNWEPLGNRDNYHWKVNFGVMTNTGGGGAANIVSKQKFWNFRARIEFRVPPGGNSGVYLRGRHEIQVADTYGQAEPSWHMCGALYSRIAPSVNAALPTGEWQTFDIKLIDHYLTVIHNGQIIIDNEEVEGATGGMIDVNESEPGPIYLQGDHGRIEYRRITVWPAE